MNKPALSILTSLLPLPSLAQAAQGDILFPGADLLFLGLCLLLGLATFGYRSQYRRIVRDNQNPPGQPSVEQQILDQTPMDILWFDDTLTLVGANQSARAAAHHRQLNGTSVCAVAPELSVDEVMTALRLPDSPTGSPEEGKGGMEGAPCSGDTQVARVTGPDDQPYGVLYRRPQVCAPQLQAGEQISRTTEGTLSQAWENFNRMQSEFVANINHEIRTPMNAIIGYAEMLSAANIGQREKRFVSIIHKSSMALVAIFNDIMELSKIDSGRLQIMPSSIRLQTIIDEVDSLFKETALEKEIRFSCQIGPSLPQMVIIDGIRLKQILQNLVSNAIKFTQKGHVQLTVDGQPSLAHADCYDLRFQVEDSGIGVTEAEQKKIFELFQQYEKMVPKQYGGIGLGLTLCSRLVAMMGGSIDLISREGEGSCFTVCLNKIRVAEQAADPFPAEISTVLQERSGTILVVDDMDLIKDVFVDYFQDSSFKVLTANDSDQALAICRKEKPDVIFMDLNLAGTDGRTVTLNLRKLEGMKEIPVIVMTGEVLEENEYRPLFDGLLQKPFRLEELKAMVARCSRSGGQSNNQMLDISQQRELEAITELWTGELEQLRLTAFNSGSLSVAVALGEAVKKTGQQHGQSLLVDMGNELIRCATEPDITGVDRLLVKLAQGFARENI